MLYRTACDCTSLLFVRRKIGYLGVKQPSTYGAYCFGCLPLITSIYRRTNARHLKAVFCVQILTNTNEAVCHTASEYLPKNARKTALRQQISATVNGYARTVAKKREKDAF